MIKPKSIIINMKKYVKMNNISPSKFIANFLMSIINNKEIQNNINPFKKSLTVFIK